MARPTSPDPKSEFVVLRMTVGEAADLDKYASVSGMRRSAFVRDCVRRVIDAEKKKAAKLKGRV